MAIILPLLVIAGFILFIYESPYDKTSEAVIRQAAAAQLNKDPNELTDNDFAKITEFSLMEKINVGLGPGEEKLFMYKKIKLSDIRLFEKFTNL